MSVNIGSMGAPTFGEAQMSVPIVCEIGFPGPWPWAPTRYYWEESFNIFLITKLAPVTKEGKSPREPPNLR
eukprot:3812410-Karenia_brevis.AAC.1